MKTVYLALCIVFAFACNSVSQEVGKTGSFGEKITAEGAVTPADLLAAMEDKSEIEKIKVTGEVSAVCKKKGCWMKMNMGDADDMRITFKDYGFFVPLDCDGKTAIMEGKAFIQETSVDDLRHYAEDAGKSKEEIAAITEPLRELTFEATGVIIQ
ncbi:MAG: DUF4920 domain-containing protein [Bacteroidia bacterium]|nr:DUF4920 domain-containing protein [Bacteroidia bacterium]NNM16154.1 DUF4920 domain-containing protein [Bacteroidia bacterium]